MDRHICGYCKSKGCPDAGNEKYDGMMGPTIMCLNYKPGLWSFDGLLNATLVLGVIGVVLCLIHAIINQGL